MEEQLVEHAHLHPPRCIAGLGPLPLRNLLPGMDAYPSIAYFTVGCPCGERTTYPLGYHAQDEGPSSEEIFIGPLGIECPACGRISELLDTRQHGHNGE